MEKGVTRTVTLFASLRIFTVFMHDFPLDFHCFTGFLLIFTDFFGFLRERQQVVNSIIKKKGI